MDKGAKVTYNGVVIGRVTAVQPDSVNKLTRAKITLEVDPRIAGLDPGERHRHHQGQHRVRQQVCGLLVTEKSIAAVSFTQPDASMSSSVTTEFNTLFETIMSIAEKVDPIKLNPTLTATAEALTGLGDRFGDSLVNGNAILDQVNPRMPLVRYDNQRLTELADIYTDASPDLWDALRERSDHRHHPQRPARRTSTQH